MGTTLFSPTTKLNLTPREIEVCAMHFVDGHDQRLIAQWLGLTLQTIRECVARALMRQPQLRKLRHKTRRPKIVHMSQIENQRDLETAPFNPDEL